MALAGNITRPNKRYPGNGAYFEKARAFALDLVHARDKGKPWPVLTPSQKRFPDAQWKELRQRNAALEVDLSNARAALEVANNERRHLVEMSQRNAALEENTLHVQAELEQRREELVAMGQRLDAAAQENSDLRRANAAQCDGLQQLRIRLKERTLELGGVKEALEVANAETSLQAKELEDAKQRNRTLKADLLAANNEAARLYDLLAIIRKTAKLAKA